MIQKLFKVWLITLAIILSSPSFSEDWLYTVRKNDEAITLGNKYLINPYRIDNVLTYNNLTSTNDLKAGMVLKFPLELLKFGPARVQVVAIQGEVQLYRSDKKTPLEIVTSIQLKDKIVTSENGSATLRFADKSELLLGNSSELVFDVLTRWGRTGMVDSRMRLLQGSVEGRVETLQGPGAHFEVHTPSAVATVRGTEFRVRVDKDKTNVSYNEVSEGKVKVESNKNGQLVKEGFGIVSEEGKESGKPVVLLAPPSLIDAKKEFPAKPVTLAWNNNPKAKSYRVELFSDKAFKKQIDSKVIHSDELKLNNINGGDYAVRIRAVDENGLEGLNTVHYFSLSGAPMMPKGLSTKNNLIAGESIVFDWLALEDAESYQLEVAKKQDFTTIAASELIETNKAQLKEVLSPGTYFWRVNGNNEFGSGYNSEVSSFTVELPEPPRVTALNDIELGSVAEARWKSTPHASGYQWQLAQDTNFVELVSQGSVKVAKVELANLPEGEYYFRVAANGPHNKERFGAVEKLTVTEKGNGKNPFMFSSLLLILLAL